MTVPSLRFVIPGPPVGLEHEAGRKGGGRRTADRSRAYMKHCGTYAMKAIADNRQQGQWPYGGDVWMDLEIYYTRKSPRPDPLNVADAIQDGCTKVLWKDDRNVLTRIQRHWWRGKNADRIPPILFENGKFTGGVCVSVRRI